MKEGITSCQVIDDQQRVINICPFYNLYFNSISLGKNIGQLRCKYGANLSIYSCVVINFIPPDCPLIKEDITITLNVI